MDIREKWKNAKSIDIINTKKLHLYMMSDRARLMLYRSLAWFSFIILLGLMIILAGFCAWIMNQSMLHDPRNNLQSGIMALMSVFLFMSPLWISLLVKIISNLYATKEKS